MLIYCPKCNSAYDVAESLIPNEGRRLRCSNCKEVFRFDKTGISESIALKTEDAKDDYSESLSDEKINDVNAVKEGENASISEEEDKSIDDKEISMQEIFERLNEQSEKLFQEEQKMPWKQRLILQIKTMLSLNRKFNFKIIGAFCLVFFVLLAYNYRYEVVRAVPFANYIYAMFGIQAKIPGEGLEFQNVNWNYMDDNGRKILEVKGFINNPTQKEIEIPVLHVELLDKDSRLLQSINQKPSIERLRPESRVAIGVIIKAPSPTAKYVYMTFIDVD